MGQHGDTIDATIRQLIGTNMNPQQRVRGVAGRHTSWRLAAFVAARAHADVVHPVVGAVGGIVRSHAMLFCVGLRLLLADLRILLIAPVRGRALVVVRMRARGHRVAARDAKRQRDDYRRRSVPCRPCTACTLRIVAKGGRRHGGARAAPAPSRYAQDAFRVRFVDFAGDVLAVDFFAAGFFAAPCLTVARLAAPVLATRGFFAAADFARADFGADLVAVFFLPATPFALPAAALALAVAPLALPATEAEADFFAVLPALTLRLTAFFASPSALVARRLAFFAVLRADFPMLAAFFPTLRFTFSSSRIALDATSFDCDDIASPTRCAPSLTESTTDPSFSTNVLPFPICCLPLFCRCAAGAFVVHPTPGAASRTRSQA